MTSKPVVRVARYGRVMHAILDRTEKRNAIDLAVADGLFAAVRDFGASDDVAVLLVRAEGSYFSAGADINSSTFPDDDILARPSAFRRWYRGGTGSLHPLSDEIEALEKPVVVAHQGPCLGGALELSLACDSSPRKFDIMAEYGITGYGACAPRLRLQRSAIAAAHRWMAPSLKGLARVHR